MICSAVFWGCIADVKGRKKCLLLAYFLDALCMIGSAASQNVLQLMIFKYLGGFM